MSENKIREKTSERLSAVVRSLIALISGIIDFFLGKKCPKCGKRAELRDGYYSCGWNYYCGQAIGRKGIFCMNCMKVTFYQSLEEHRKTLPHWCKASR